MIESKRDKSKTMHTAKVNLYQSKHPLKSCVDLSVFPLPLPFSLSHSKMFRGIQKKKEEEKTADIATLQCHVEGNTRTTIKRERN